MPRANTISPEPSSARWKNRRSSRARKSKAGDLLLALASTGLHTNGYSLARKLLFDVAGFTMESRLDATGSLLADELLRVHRSYLKPIQAFIEAGCFSTPAHITGGGHHR